MSNTRNAKRGGPEHRPDPGARTLRHFWPGLNDRLDQVPDPRPQASTTYHPRFLLWWGLCLFLFKLGSRRQLDYELGKSGPQVLANLNRLAGTNQTSLPVNKTLNDYLGKVGGQPLADVRTWMVRLLIQEKVMDERVSRAIASYYSTPPATSVFTNATVRIAWCANTSRARSICTRCWRPNSWDRTGVVSVGTAFIENPDLPPDVIAEQFKQDCELKAWHRLRPN